MRENITLESTVVSDQSSFIVEHRTVSEEGLARRYFRAVNLSTIIGRSDAQTPEDIERAVEIAWGKDPYFETSRRIAWNVAKEMWPSLDVLPAPKVASSTLKDPKNLSVAKLVELLGLKPVTHSLRLAGTTDGTPCGKCMFCQGGPEASGVEGCLAPLEDQTIDRRVSKLEGLDVAMGLDVFLVEPKRTCVITTQPYVPFRPKAVALPRDVTPHFQINDVKSGKFSAFLTSIPIPDDVICMMEFDFGILSVSQQFSVSLTNISDEIRAFRGAVLGESCK